VITDSGFQSLGNTMYGSSAPFFFAVQEALAAAGLACAISMQDGVVTVVECEGDQE
jgi:hypothetical protein